jgi:hypothetical protein
MISNLVKYLKQNNMPFKFGGNAITMDGASMDYLMENKIEFEFNGEQIVVQVNCSDLTASTMRLVSVDTPKVTVELGRTVTLPREVIVGSWNTCTIEPDRVPVKPEVSVPVEDPTVKAKETLLKLVMFVSNSLTSSTLFDVTVSNNTLEVVHKPTRQAVNKNVLKTLRASLEFLENRVLITYPGFHELVFQYGKPVEELLAGGMEKYMNAFTLMLIVGLTFNNVKAVSWEAFTYVKSSNDTILVNYGNNNGNAAIFEKNSVPLAFCTSIEECLREIYYEL